MYPSSFYKMKNFANPKTMFKSCSNNEEFSTTPVQSCSPPAKGATKSGQNGGTRSGSGSSSNASYKSVTNEASCSGDSSACSPLSTPRSDLSRCTTPEAACSSSTAATAAGAAPASAAQAVNPSAQATGTDEQPASGDSASASTSAVAITEVGGAGGGSEADQLPSEPHHPLNSEWTLWYLETDRSKSWEEMLHEVASFNTVENFWSLINHIKTPSEIKIGSDYCLFKKGIRPMWEDEANVKGGRWVITLNKSNKNDLDNFWLDTMLVLIGESCDYAQELCGAVVNIRAKNNKISIWTANGGNEAAALEIGGKLREGLRMDATYVLQYQLHKDTMAKQGSLVKTIYTR